MEVATLPVHHCSASSCLDAGSGGEDEEMQLRPLRQARAKWSCSRRSRS